MYCFKSEEDLEDKLQDFYVLMKEQRTLRRYDASKGASFSTWIANALNWVLKDKGYRARLVVMVPWEEDLLNHSPSESPDPMDEVRQRIRYYRKYLRTIRAERMDDILEQMDRKIRDMPYTDSYAAQLLHRHAQDFKRLDD
jgi:hypothetical protein